MNKLSANGKPTNRVLSVPLFSKGIKIPATIVSILFHPFFIPLIGTWLIAQTHYYEFAGFHKKEFISLYGSIITNTVLLPFFTLFMLVRLKFISGFWMPKKRDRVIPYIALMTFYIWTYLVFKKQMMMPEVIKVFLLGNFIASILGFLSILKIKLSMHTLGMGCLIGLVFCFMGNPFVNVIFLFIGVLFIAGLIATCRMIHSYRTSLEIYLGFIFGVFAQILAFWMI